MQSKYVVIFIDDEAKLSKEKSYSARAGLIEQLQKDTRFELITFHPVEFEQLGVNGRKAYSPDLVIVDYKLQGVENDEGLNYDGTGYTMTSLCKEAFPDVPCYLISQLIEKSIEVGDHYDKKISHRFLTEASGKDVLASDCDSFRAIRNANSNLDSYFSLLCVPDEQYDDVRNSMPYTLLQTLRTSEQNEINDSEKPCLLFARWINKYFLSRRGPTMSTLEFSTLLGLKEEYFIKDFTSVYEDKLENLKYKGVFYNSFPTRWWSQMAYNFAIELSQGSSPSEPWRVIPELLSIDEKNWSCCEICAKPLPETVALDRESGEWGACHWACCIEGDISEDIAGFEPVLYID